MSASLGQREEGAVAVIVALMALVLLGVGAFAVDFGQVYAKRSALQSNVDMAVLAAAAQLDNAGPCNAEVIATATEYLTKDGNEVADQVAIDLGGSAGDDTGFISCSDWTVELWAPKSAVEFGLAKALSSSNSGLNVPAHAAAQIMSPSRSSSLPMFAVDGCDYGSQIIRDDSGPADPPAVPPLTPTSAATNTANFTISPDITPAGTASLTLTLSGSDLDGADAVGFTGAGGPPDHYEVPSGDLTIAADGSSITLNVPGQVLALEDVWYVRVLKGTAWSPEQEAQRFTVGEPRLYCASSVEGNFGTLDVPRNDTPFDLEWNMIFGLQPSLVRHPSPAGECGGDGPPTVESKTNPVDGTNCVATQTGLNIAGSNKGLVTGAGGKNGRLDADTTPGCSRSKGDGRTPTAIKGKNINDDVLSCFITTGARVSDVVNGTAAGTNVLSSDIFASPRYFWIPVVASEPATGKKSWPIVDFRPGFITDQPLTATSATPGGVSEFNGLVESPSGLRSLNVILFDEVALPETAPPVGGEVEYTGSGTKVIVLVK